MRKVKSRAPDSSGRRRGGKAASRLDEMRPGPAERMGSRAESGQRARASQGMTLVQRRPMLVLTLALVVAGAGAGLFAGGHFVKLFRDAGNALETAFAGAGFSIHEIALAGNERTNADIAYGALGIQKGQSIFAADPSAMRTRLIRLPWVSDAEVRRQYPGTVAIRLIEKRPFALWKNGADLSVIERSGAIITAAGPNAFKRLPVLVGVGAPRAAAPLIDALAQDKAVEARLKAAERVGERRWDLLLDGGVTVKLPEAGWEAQLGELERLIVEKGVLERDIELIDLRYPDSYVFRLHNGDSRPVLRERHA